MAIKVKHVNNCKISFIQGRAKIGVYTKVLGKINTSCDKKYSLENPHSTRVQKIKNSPVTLEPREGTKARRFRNLAPCRVIDSRAAHCIVRGHDKSDRSRGSKVNRPKFEGQQLPPT